MQGALDKLKVMLASDQHKVGAPVMVIDFAPDADVANDFTLTHNLPTGRHGRLLLVPLRASDFPGLHYVVAK